MEKKCITWGKSYSSVVVVVVLLLLVCFPPKLHLLFNCFYIHNYTSNISSAEACRNAP